MKATRIRVRAVPNSREAAVVGPYGEGWKIRVRSAPEDGKANKELQRLLATILTLDRSAISVVAGVGSRDKIVAISGRTSEEVTAALSSAC